MNGNNHLVVIGDNKVVQNAVHSGSSVGGYHKVTLFIVAAACTYSLNKSGIELVDDLSCLLISAVPFHGSSLETGFVHALEYELFIIVLEVIGDLSPESTENFLGAFLIVRSGHMPFLVVHIEDNEHIIVNAVIHNFLDSCKPVSLDSVIWSLAELALPGHRYTQNVEALSLYAVYHCLCGNRLTPCSFPVSGSFAACGVGDRGIQSISQIPARFHLADKLH